MEKKLKEEIDQMDYVEMLDRWRHAPVGDPIFQGESGDYFKKVMYEKYEELSQDQRVQASKNVGWENN